MIIGSIKEDLSLEKRVSITPETAKNIISLGIKVIIENNGERKRLLEGQFRTVRGIEQMSSNRFNITSVGNVFEINKSGKIFHRMHLRIDKEDAERNLRGKVLRKMQEKKLVKGRCGSKTGNLYKVVKTK